MLKLVRKMFVEFRISFVFNITIGTYENGKKETKNGYHLEDILHVRNVSIKDSISCEMKEKIK